MLDGSSLIAGGIAPAHLTDAKVFEPAHHSIDSLTRAMQEPCLHSPAPAPAAAPPSDEVTQPVLDKANKVCLLLAIMARVI